MEELLIPPLWLTQQGVYPHRINFADAMLTADFCYSPLGSHGGDTGEWQCRVTPAVSGNKRTCIDQLRITTPVSGCTQVHIDQLESP